MTDEEQETDPSRLIGLDNKPVAAETRHSYRVERQRVPQTKYSPTTKKFLKYRQEERHRTLIAKGHEVLVRNTGATVYKGERDDFPTLPPGWAYRHNSIKLPEPPILTPQQRKRRVDRWMENHPGEMPRDESD